MTSLTYRAAAPRLVIALCAAATLSLGALAAAPALAQGNDPVAAHVDGVPIHQSDLDLAAQEIGSTLRGDNAAARRKALINYVADMILLAKAAEGQGLGSTTEFAQKLHFAKTRLLMDAMLQQAADKAVTDDALHKVYDQAVKQMAPQPEVRARHILVPTKAEAEAILTQLRNGADFAKLAKEKSKDPGAANGGELGYFTKDQMVPAFSKAAFNLKKGEYSEPVKTQFGWHIIQVEDKRMKPVPTFDQVKPQLVQFLQRKAQAEMVTKLRAGAKIETVPVPAKKP